MKLGKGTYEWIWWTSKWGIKLDRTLLQTIYFDLPISPVIPGAGEDSSTPCSPKAEEAGGPTLLLTPLLDPSLYCPAFSCTPTLDSLLKVHGLDLKFLFRACHAFYMHGEWEGLKPKLTSPLSPPWVSSGIFSHIHHTYHYFQPLSSHFLHFQH